MIATLSTGSWYKMSHNYYDTVIESLNSNCREIIARGADANIMRRVIAVMINRMMTVKVDGNSYDLEWWRFRHGSKGVDNTSSIWYGTGDAEPAPVLDKAAERVGSGMPDAALCDWMLNKRRWLAHIDAKLVTQYKAELKNETYKSFYGEWRQKMRDVEALEKYGKRSSKTGVNQIVELERKGIFKLDNACLPNREQREYLWKMIDGSMAVRRPMTEEVLLDVLGIDPKLLRMLGGWKGFYKVAKHKDRAMWQQVSSLSEVEIPLWMNLLDPALSSWWRIKNEVEE
jgi:hypothetical protein